MRMGSCTLRELSPQALPAKELFKQQLAPGACFGRGLVDVNIGFEYGKADLSFDTVTRARTPSALSHSNARSISYNEQHTAVAAQRP